MGLGFTDKHKPCSPGWMAGLAVFYERHGLRPRVHIEVYLILNHGLHDLADKWA